MAFIRLTQIVRGHQYHGEPDRRPVAAVTLIETVARACP
jgi:hypothetical protein